MSRGLFLSLDGVDGTGKSTQCRLLADWLRGLGREVVSCVDPGGTPVGNAIRDILLHRPEALALPGEAFLFMASRAQLVAEVIRPALEASRIVVSDRFLLATVVYQGHAGGLDIDLLWRMGDLATGGLRPDLTLVLDVPREVARARRKSVPDRVERRPEEYHQRVRDGFLAEAARDPERVRVVDASDDVAAVHERIRREVAGVLGTNPRA
jgi:dTMP kinase